MDKVVSEQEVRDFVNKHRYKVPILCSTGTWVGFDNEHDAYLYVSGKDDPSLNNVRSLVLRRHDGREYDGINNYFSLEPFLAEVVEKREVSYSSSGKVLGEAWGGGQGYYPARKVTGDTYEEVKKSIIERLDSGSLDSGFGFKSLIRFEGVIKTHIRITVDGVPYSRIEKDWVKFSIRDN